MSQDVVKLRCRIAQVPLYVFFNSQREKKIKIFIIGCLFSFFMNYFTDYLTLVMILVDLLMTFYETALAVCK